MRFHRSGEAPRSGMKASSNCSCLPALPTMRATSTVLLPRRRPPYAPLAPRSSSNERSLPVPDEPPRRLLRACSRDLRLATLNSLSTCSVRLINSTTAATPCSRPGLPEFYPPGGSRSGPFVVFGGSARRRKGRGRDVPEVRLPSVELLGHDDARRRVPGGLVERPRGPVVPEDVQLDLVGAEIDRPLLGGLECLLGVPLAPEGGEDLYVVDPDAASCAPILDREPQGADLFGAGGVPDLVQKVVPGARDRKSVV